MMVRCEVWLLPLACLAIVLADSRNPYEALGVSQLASHDEIKKRYRRLCLEFHPDKNVGSSEEEKKRCENAFKSVQEAYSIIGDKESRRQYDSSALYPSMSSQYQGDTTYGSRRSTSSTTSREDLDEYLHRYFNSRSNPYSNNYPRRRRSFYVNGIDVSHLFNPNGSGSGKFNHGRDSSYFPNQDMEQLDEHYPKSIFVEKVTVPLQELYSGISRRELVLRNGLLQRYKAAFRGGIAKNVAVQGLLASAPLLLRVSWPVSLLSFLITFHLSLPQPTKRFYFTNIRRGWKEGTKLKFNVEPKVDVVFIIKEGSHHRYTRDGDDLKTSITIERSKAKRGCNLLIDPLGEHELPVMVKLSPGQVVFDRQVVVCKGRGWPKKSGGCGDLHISVRLTNDSHDLKRRRKGRGNSKRKGHKD